MKQRTELRNLGTAPLSWVDDIRRVADKEWHRYAPREISNNEPQMIEKVGEEFF